MIIHIEIKPINLCVISKRHRSSPYFSKKPFVFASHPNKTPELGKLSRNVFSIFTIPLISMNFLFMVETELKTTNGIPFQAKTIIYNVYFAGSLW